MKFIVHVNSVIINNNNQLVLVTEGKNNSAYGKLNHPGGHLEYNETILDCAKREIFEEVGIVNPVIDYLIGVYTGISHEYFISYIFHGTSLESKFYTKTSEILKCEWYDFDEIEKIEDEKLLNPAKIRDIIADYKRGNRIPLEYLHEKKY